MSIRWAVFVSGQGTNLQNILDLESQGEITKNSVVSVFSDRPCRALERAEIKQKATLMISPSSANFDSDLYAFLEKHQVDRIFLLGYMRILSARFLALWKKPIVNLHPSLLPKYPGLHSIERAFQAKDPYMGVTLHEVVLELDAGPMIRQISFPSKPAWTLEEATEEVHRMERRLVREYLLELDSRDLTP